MAPPLSQRVGGPWQFARRALFRVYRRIKPGVVKEDEFRTWLSWAIGGWFDAGNAHLFEQALSQLPSSSPILEIGSFCGLSTSLLLHELNRRRLPNVLFTCDAWTSLAAAHLQVGDSSIRHDEYFAHVRETFVRNVRFFGQGRLPHSYELPSEEFSRAWRQGEERTDLFGRRARLGGSLSFAYIDGEHSYRGCRQDFDFVDAVLESRGLILFDDSADETTWPVRRVVAEALGSGRYEQVSKNPNYLIRKL